MGPLLVALVLMGSRPCEVEGQVPSAAPLVNPDRTADQDPGFRFQRPRGSLGIRGGFYLHRADGDLYAFTEERFTVERSDYRGWSLGLEGSLWIGNRAEMTLGLDGSRVTLHSEYRDWEENGNPIQQATRLRTGPAVTLGTRAFLFERGDSLGQFIWIPSEWNVFAGGGVGLTGYGLEMWGDFVDEVEETISTASFDSGGRSFFPFLSAGVEVSLSTRFAATVEGRYHWGSSELESDFEGFADALDLSGARLTAGINYRF